MVITTTCASKLIGNHVNSFDLIKPTHSLTLLMVLVIGLAVAPTSSNAAAARVSTVWRRNPTPAIDREGLRTAAAMLERRLGAGTQSGGNSQLVTISANGRVHHLEGAPSGTRTERHVSSQGDLSQADQMDEPSFSTQLDRDSVDLERIGGTVDRLDLDRFGEPDRGHSNYNNRDSIPNQSAAHEDVVDQNPSSEPAERNLFTLSNHNTQLRTMRDMFERRHLDHNNNNQHRLSNNRLSNSNSNNNNNQNIDSRQHGSPLQSSQELSPISIGLDNVSPFAMPPFQLGMNDGGAAQAPPPPPPMPSMGVHMKSQMANADNLDGGGLEPTLPFGLNPLPHLLGFQSAAFDGPQRGDQSAHSNQHAAAAPQADTEPTGGAGSGGVGGPGGSGQKSWPKIFRFTDGRINLSDFEKQKKIRLSNKHNENHIESAPIMFDGRPLKRKSFLILHGGVFP